MFSYVDPTIRERLLAAGKLIRINGKGQLIDPDAHPEDGDFSLNVLSYVPLPIDVGDQRVVFKWYAFVRHTELAQARQIAEALEHRGDERLLPLLSTYMSVNSALVHGQPDTVERPLVRVHSSCLTGDVFGSKRCECGPQLDWALERIVSDPSGAGILVYMAGHEGRGIGLWAKAITYLLQDSGQDTYQANRSLGLPDDSRDFSDAAAVLRFLLGGDKPIRLMSNNPKKRHDLEAAGLSDVEMVSHVIGVNEHNRRYLRAKRKWGHIIDNGDID